MLTRQRAQRAPARPRRRLDIMGFWREYSRDQRLFIIEAMLSNSASVITGGVFLTGLLVMMGATNLTVGLVTSAGTWSLMLSLIASVAVERVRNKKALMAWSLALFRLLTTLPVFLPAFMGNGLPTAFAAAVMMITGNAAFSLFNIGFPVFFMDALPREGRVSYIYTRMLLLRIAYTLVSVAMGLLLDALDKSYMGFIIVYSFAIALSAANVYYMTKIKGPDAPSARQPAMADITKRLFDPFRNKRYIRFLVYTFCYFFFFCASSSYTALYQVKYLHLSYAFLTILNTCIYVLMILVTRRWAAIERNIGSLKVLVLCSLLLSVDFVVYSFLTSGTLWLLAFSVIFAGLGSSGYWVCLLPYRYSLMPEEGKTVYEGWFGFIYGAANLLGALAGSTLQGLIPEIQMGPLAFSNFQAVYLLTGVMAVTVTLAFWSAAKKDKHEELYPGVNG